MATLARSVVQDNGLQHTVSVVSALSTDITPRQLGGRRADVLVARGSVWAVE